MTDITIVNQQITATITEPDQISVVVTPPSEVLVTLEYAQGPGGSGGGSGAGVSSFNGRVGDVTSVQSDYDTFFTTPTEVTTIANARAAAEVDAHEALSDPHPQYLTQTEGDARYSQTNHTHTSTSITDFVEAAQDATGAMVSGNTEDGLSVTYDDASNKLNFTNTDKGSTAVASHTALSDPHPQYLTQTEGDSRYDVAVLDEGVEQTASVGSINFVGSGVSTSTTGDAVTVTITGGGGGTAGVTSFNGRVGDVTSVQSDYDAFFTTPTEATAIANSAATSEVDAHEALADPHPQYLTQSEGDTRYAQLGHTHTSANITDFVEAAQDATGAMVSGNTEDGISVTYNDVANKLDFTNTDKGSVAVTAHEALADPHPQYTTNLEATTIANSVVTAHEASSDPHPQYLTQSEGDTRYNVSILDEGALQTASVASINFVGSGVSTSTVGEDITVTINGGGGGGGGSYDLTQLATDVDALPLSTPLADDFDINMRDGATPSIVKVPSINAEVIAARGTQTNLDNRFKHIASGEFSYPVLLPGFYFDNTCNSPTVNGSAAPSRMYLGQFFSPKGQTVDELGFVVRVEGVAGAIGKVVVYGANELGEPTGILFEGSSSLDCSTVGAKLHAELFTFEAGRQYWVGLVCGESGFSYLARSTSASANIKVFSADPSSTSYQDTLVFFGLNYNALPESPTIAANNFGRGGCPVIRMRWAV